MGCLARPARRHRRARRRHRCRTSRWRAARSRSTRRPSASPRRSNWRSVIRTRASFFSGGTGALLGEAAGSAGRGRGIRGARRRARPRHCGRAVAQYHRECGVLAAARRSQARRALASGDLGVPHAARHRGVPGGGLSGRGLSGRLAHARAGDVTRPFSSLSAGLTADRHRRARMARAAGLLAHRTDRGTVSGPVAAPRSGDFRCGRFRPVAARRFFTDTFTNSDIAVHAVARPS